MKKQDAPRYVPGFTVVVVTSIAAGLLVLVYRLVCVWHNRQRDKAGILEGFDHAYEDDLTDLKVSPYDETVLCGPGLLTPRFRIRSSDISCRQRKVQQCDRTVVVYSEWTLF